MATTPPKESQVKEPKPKKGWAKLSQRAKSLVVATVGIAGTAGGVLLPHIDDPKSGIIALKLDVINGCGLGGSVVEAKTASDTEKEKENREKNRWDFPSDETFAAAADFDALARATEHPPEGFTSENSAEIEGYVTEVKKGGKESCNCGTNVPEFMDTHIYIGKTPDAPKTESLIVEVTPRIRMILAQQGIDWSSKALKKDFEHKYVRVSGWLFYDKEHERNSVANGRSGKAVWRASCWEIHPVTDIQIVEPKKPKPK